MRITDTHVYFYSGIYSNWHPITIEDNISNLTFNNTEQAFMYYKAKFFEDEEIAHKISLCSDPKGVKELGRQIFGYDDIAWGAVRFGIMKWVNYMKFSQNDNFKKELLGTGDKILVEASPYDSIWGVKMQKWDDDILIESNWKGQNLLGKVLMEVRSMLR